MARELRVLVEWETVLHRMLDCSARFPKSVRYSFVHRIDNLVLDITQHIVQAQYAPPEEQLYHLSILNSKVAQLRLLWRISADRGYLSIGQLRDIIASLEGIGYQVHAWVQQGKHEEEPKTEGML
jgi:hypothetical protein